MSTMKRVAYIASALTAFALPSAFATTAMNGSQIDPLNLIADDLEGEALNSYLRNARVAPFRGNEIVIVDYRLPSSTRRLYVLNLMTGAVETHYVAHGKGSDPGHSNVALRFGDTEGSGMSSLGAYRGAARYDSPAHGPALRLQGLDVSNRSAYDRAIVMHTAAYFDPANGRLGRSLGCFVVTGEDRSRIYDVIADGGFLYAGPSCLGTGSCRKQDVAKPDIIMANAESKPAPAPVIVAEAPAPKPAPAKPAVVLAAATPAVTPRPVPAIAKAAPPPVVFADNIPAPRTKPRLEAAPVLVAFDAPVPKAKPAIDSDDQIAAALEILGRHRAPESEPMPDVTVTVAFDIPLPLAKPAVLGGPALVAAAEDDIPVPLLKPSLDMSDDAVIAATDTVTGQADLAVAEGVPQPLAKPASFDTASAELAPLVPATKSGDVPVPAPKPGGLRTVADASAR